MSCHTYAVKRSKDITVIELQAKDVVVGKHIYYIYFFFISIGILPMRKANCESTLFYQRMKECGFHDEKKNLLKLADYQENMLILRFTRLAFLV